jgi:hypothetical protein
MTMTTRWRSEFGGFLGLRPNDFIGEEGITEADMEPYTMPQISDAIETHFLGQYLPWDSHTNAEVAIKHGLVWHHPGASNYWEWENLDNAQTGLHDYFGYLKYGYTRGQAQIAVDVRSGRLTRAVGLSLAKKLKRTLPQLYCGVSLHDVLRGIGKSIDWVMKQEDKFRNDEVIAWADNFWSEV